MKGKFTNPNWDPDKMRLTDKISEAEYNNKSAKEIEDIVKPYLIKEKTDCTPLDIFLNGYKTCIQKRLEDGGEVYSLKTVEKTPYGEICKDYENRMLELLKERKDALGDERETLNSLIKHYANFLGYDSEVVLGNKKPCSINNERKICYKPQNSNCITKINFKDFVDIIESYQETNKCNISIKGGKDCLELKIKSNQK